MAQWFKLPTFDFGSGHDLTAPRIESHIRLHNGSAEPAWDLLSPSLSLCPYPALSLKINK